MRVAPRMCGGYRTHSAIALKTPEEARATIAEWDRIDRGFLNSRWTLAIMLAAILFAIFRAPLLLALAVGALAVDFAVFCVRRARTLVRYNAGQPRLTTAADWEAVSRSFVAAGEVEPTMSDWESAAGHAARPQWRTDLRYQELLR